MATATDAAGNRLYSDTQLDASFGWERGGWQNPTIQQALDDLESPNRATRTQAQRKIVRHFSENYDQPFAGEQTGTPWRPQLVREAPSPERGRLLNQLGVAAGNAENLLGFALDLNTEDRKIMARLEGAGQRISAEFGIEVPFSQVIVEKLEGLFGDGQIGNRNTTMTPEALEKTLDEAVTQGMIDQAINEADEIENLGLTDAKKRSLGTKVRALHAQRMAFASQYARAVAGESGVLNEGDIQRALAMLPKIGQTREDTEETGRILLKNIRTMYQNTLLGSLFGVGDVLGSFDRMESNINTPPQAPDAPLTPNGDSPASTRMLPASR